jgi:hypothetical protein
MTIHLRGALALALSSVGLAACMSRPGDGNPTPTPTPQTPNPPNPPPPPPPPPPPDPTRPIPSFPTDSSTVADAQDCSLDVLVGPEVYGAKVKTLLTGLPLTESELTALQEDPAALRSLIDRALEDPKSDAVLRRFFMMAFQQDQVTGEGVMMMTNINNTNWGVWDDTQEALFPLLVDNLEQSFARTALRIVKEGGDFRDVLTTDTFEMTTALMVFYSYLDHRHVNDDDSMFTRPMGEVTNFVALRNQADEPPADQVLDPNSPNFMHIHHQNFDELCLAETVDEFPFAANAVNNVPQFVFLSMMGKPETVNNRAAGANCRATGVGRRRPLLREEDFSDWRTVRIRQPLAGETPTRFYRAPVLRNATELLSRAERVGFFTTLGFFGTWPTNEDNSSRVTLNQTLIAALGASFDGTTVTDFSPPNLDAEHAAPGSACYGCHQTLDPMRDFFRQSYSASYGEQHDQARKDLSAIFVFRGVRQDNLQGVRGLSTILAGHPDFPKAWVQKLCYYANSGPCQESPELDRVVSTFIDSGYDFRVMLRELFSSPLITNQSCFEGGGALAPSIARREQFCSSLSARLGVTDICALETPTRSRTALQRAVLAAVASIPADTVSRGEPEPITISETGLFIRATREVVCQRVGEAAFDARFSGRSREVAIKEMVEGVIGLPVNDPRHAEAVEILTAHVVDARSNGANERDALRSALVVSCMAPSVAGIGL